MAEIIIRPETKLKILDWEEIFKYRELFLIFVWRNIKVRYKQTVLGVLWVILQPLLSTGVFTIFFGRLAKIPSENLPYELFVFIGLVFWTFFANALTQSSNSLVEHSQIIKKIYFPKEILPLSYVATSFVDFFINFLMILFLLLIFGYTPSPLTILLVPVCVLITATLAGGLGLYLAALNIKYRDVRYILPFFIQILLFLTPVIYPSSIVRDSLRYIFAINPMTGVIETMRKLLTGSQGVDYFLLLISAGSAIIVFILGNLYYRSTEKLIADTA